ncbi:MAG TPA: SDR family NAD(P)-dependent oxidoreductase, partial [Phototrophicaceae bacterium]|nr:SDR family NAD(P)-dependent oxidoreductase [Phototrophicaceae bacterium]
SNVVRGFANAGAKVALVDMNMDRMNQVINDLPGDNSHYKGFVGDLSQPEAVQQLIGEIAGHFGQIDILVHTVGGYAAGQPVHEAGIDVLEKMMALNVRPLYLVGGATARHMMDKGIPGRMVFVLARAGLKGAKNMGAYTASKAAATRIMESLSAELKDHGINVNGVSPSIIDTPINRNDMPNADFSKWVTPQQLADTILYLASDQAASLHGVNLEVYGRV